MWKLILKVNIQNRYCLRHERRFLKKIVLIYKYRSGNTDVNKKNVNKHLRK